MNSLKQEFNKCTEEMIQNKIIKTNLELDLSIQLSIFLLYQFMYRWSAECD